MPVKLKLWDGVKLGVGFFLGYKIAESINEIAGEIYLIAKKRIKQGYL